MEIKDEWWEAMSGGDEDRPFSQYIEAQRRMVIGILDDLAVPSKPSWPVPARVTWLGCDDKRRRDMVREVEDGGHGYAIDTNTLDTLSYLRAVADEMRKTSAVLDIFRVPGGAGWPPAARVAWLGSTTMQRMAIETRAREARENQQRRRFATL